MTTFFLVHGGLWEPGMDAHRFWHVPGIVTGLEERRFDVLAPDRPVQPPSWSAEAEHLAELLPDRPVTMLAGSNGTSAAVRLALANPERFDRLILAWPATAGHPEVDARTRRSLIEQGAAAEIADALLAGETLRGVEDAELATLTRPVGLLPAVPEDPFHQHHTVDSLEEALPNTVRLPGTTEPPRPDFGQQLNRFLDAVTLFARP
ncbi:alpha/beta hydrolase [Phytoactinopolyspora alkaliphila]|uniref:Alpha/beta hydrolase n=1 Tax=Phytoactinopolyspora alkaliphila TaxID=1783498 RepID=A0A6N9YTE9_9ACTN|nr:alpha/beta hydrolase [Phytoactinopolyspora alkaliphila]NED98220.1 alpha/beta hydrolase [Phytoactinopolyspora alkaliphila]